MNGNAKSLMSEDLKAYTNNDVAEPVVALRGVTGSPMILYFNRNSYTVEAVVTNQEQFRQIDYQWQRRIASLGRWMDLFCQDAKFTLSRDSSEDIICFDHSGKPVQS